MKLVPPSKFIIFSSKVPESFMFLTKEVEACDI